MSSQLSHRFRRRYRDVSGTLASKPWAEAHGYHRTAATRHEQHRQFQAIRQAYRKEDKLIRCRKVVVMTSGFGPRNEAAQEAARRGSDD